MGHYLSDFEPAARRGDLVTTPEQTNAEGLIFDLIVPGDPDFVPTIRYDVEARKWIGENPDGGVWSRAGTLRGAMRTATARFGTVKAQQRH